MNLLDQIKADREAGTPQEWSAERTVCRNLPDTVWAIVWNETPGGRKNEDGTTNYSLRIPALLGTDWLASPEDGVTQIADMLNFAERAEAALLAAEELAKAIHDYEHLKPEVLCTYDWSGVKKALDAYCKATGERK